MEFMAFLSSLSSYLLVFIVFVVAIALAIFLGISLYKLTHKKKLQAEAENEVAEASN